MFEQPDAALWRRTFGSRLLVIAGLFGVWGLVLLGRLVVLQVFQHDFYKAWADRQTIRAVTVPAHRGDIVDRHGRTLACSVDLDSIFADPVQGRDAARTAARLCEALGDCVPSERATLAEKLARPSFLWVRRQASLDQVRRVAALREPGIGFDKGQRRFYPNRELAAHLLGYVGIDGEGLSGLERAYDAQLRGRPGLMHVHIDGSRRQRVFSRAGTPPVSGTVLELTIDRHLQHIAERELRRGVAESHAAAGTAIIMDPATGEILALANEPTFNPNTFGKAPEDSRRNRAIQDVYEPGSTFKIITASAALEERVVRPGDLIDTGNGSLTIGTRVVTDTSAHGVIPFSEVITQSSNIGTIKVGWRLGADRVSRYVRLFGFGTRLSPDFRGENAGIVWNPTDLNDSALASVSIGYQIGVTPLQMATAASAVANGGELLQPRVLRAVIEAGRRTEIPRRVLRRVTSAETAAEVTSMLEAVVDRGTAKSAQIAGFTAAGKTGTARKIIDRRYSRTDYNASFVGFAPSRAPKLTILVIIDTPRVPVYFGGAVAAPVFKRMAEAALRQLAVPPTLNPLPHVLMASGRPPADRSIAGPILPLTFLPAVGRVAEGQVVLPELRGLSGREALRVLVRLGLTAKVTGDGVVVAQDPMPGSVIEPGSACRLALGRAAPREVNAGVHP